MSEDVGDNALAQRLQEIERAREIGEGKDIRAVLRMPEGRRLLWRIIAEAGAIGPSYVKGDPTHTAFMEGQRDRGLALLALIHDVDPLLMPAMAREAAEAQMRYEQSRAAAQVRAQRQPDDA